jgi:hypothetical protein
MIELYTALAKAKSEINPIVKGAKNPFFKSKYADLNDIITEVEPLLNNHGLLLLQPIRDNRVCTSIVHIITGQTITSEIELPVISDPQKLGSAVTYYRRYTLVSLLSLQAIDDDGEIVREDIERLRQQASDLLDTSVWGVGDDNTRRKAESRIASGDYSTLKEAIKELRQNQVESVNKSMAEINKQTLDRANRDD